MCAVRSNAIQAWPGSQPGVLQVAEAVGEHPGRDHDERDRGPVEEHAHVQVDRPPVEQPAQQRRRRRCRSRRRPAARPSARRPRAAVHRNRVVSRPSRPTERNAVIVSAPVPIAAARATSPRRCADKVAAVRRIQKIIAGDQADREDAEQPADRLLARARQHADGERQHRGEGAGERHRAEHAEPDRRGRYASLAVSVGLRGRRLLHGRQQDGHHEAGLEALTEPDQEVRYAVCPSHAD